MYISLSIYIYIYIYIYTHVYTHVVKLYHIWGCFPQSSAFGAAGADWPRAHDRLDAGAPSAVATIQGGVNLTLI